MTASTKSNTKPNTKSKSAKPSKLASANKSVRQALTSKRTKAAVGYGVGAIALGFLVSLGANAAERAVNAL